ncbi:hypothetical protein [Sphingomonas panni]|uniref:hypothetical protein n=1 Tax=Sphingomonas panni TaxID=237612 RepID=UPI001F5B5EBE|nr:hypothetical protein [Sphingomonas panni]
MAIVRRYVKGNERTADEAGRLALEAGISRSLFYRLVRIYEEKATAPSTVRRGREVQRSGSVAAATTEHAISLAIERLGGSATQATVLRVAKSLCEEWGVPPPTPRIVRRAFVGAGERLDGRLGVTTRFALDRTMLGLAVDDPVGGTIAQLTCLIDLHQRRVVTHVLSAGPPSAIECAAALTSYPGSMGIAVSDTDEILLAHLSSHLASVGLPPAQNARWRMGTVVRSVIGLKLGRVPLLERRPKRMAKDAMIDLPSARRVVGALMRRRDS